MVWMLTLSEHIMGQNEVKATLKDHDHTVECIAWAPESAHPTVAEAVASDVSVLGSSRFALLDSNCV